MRAGRTSRSHARRSYSRVREWRAFGQQVVYPDTELPFDNERLEGLWQRVGDYWWLGLPMGADEQGLTGKHSQNGNVFRLRRTGRTRGRQRSSPM